MNGAPPKVRCLAEIQLRDRVQTPLGRSAMVQGFRGGRCELQYMDGDRSEVTLAHHHLSVTQRAAPVTLQVSRILESALREAKAGNGGK